MSARMIPGFGTPNVVLADVPAGGEADFVVREQVGDVPAYGFAVQDHLEVGDRASSCQVTRKT